MQYCAEQRCNKLVESGRCPDHWRVPQQQYDDRRGTSSQRGYGASWRRQNKADLSQLPLCMDPFGEHGQRIVLSTQHDHRIPKSMGGADDESNLWWLCRSCHSRKTGMETRAGKPLFSGPCPEQKYLGTHDRKGEDAA